MIKQIVKFSGFTRKKTQINLRFAVKDMSEMDELFLTQYLKTEGHLLFLGDKVKAEIEEAMKNTNIGIDESGRSQSQKMRGAIFQYWSDKFQGKMEFEEFYVKWTNSIINDIKSK